MEPKTTQSLLDELFANHPEIAGGPFTWKAAQKGPLAQDLLKALDKAYKAGEDDLRKALEAEEDKRQAGDEAKALAEVKAHHKATPPKGKTTAA